MPTLTPATEGAIWSRVIRPEVADITQEAAQAFLRLEFAESDRQRMYELAAKAREGSLTPADREEVANYERVGSFLSPAKAKARVRLKNGHTS